MRGKLLRKDQLSAHRAYITFKQKQYHLGYYATFEEAVAARKQAEKDFFGKFLEEHKI